MSSRSLLPLLTLGVLAFAAVPHACAEEAPADSARPSLARRAGRSLVHLGSDLWYVASSPSRMTRRGALTTAAVFAVAGGLYAQDQELYEASTRSTDEQPYRAVLDVSEFIEPVGLMGRTMKYYAGIAVLGYAFKVEPMRVIPVQIIESHLVSGGIRNLAKVAIGRRRPNEHLGARAFDPGTGTSLTSGHASVVFELATILSHHAHRKPVSVLCYALATALAIQRVESGNHWASDVFLGAVAGTVGARTIVRRNEERAGLVPTVSASGGGGVRLGLATRF